MMSRRGGGEATVTGFDALGGPIVAVCGLHGGAGTTSLTAALARSAARWSSPERVLAMGVHDDLDRLLGGSPVSSSRLVRLGELGQDPSDPPHAVTADGLRVLTGDPAGVTTGLGGLLANAGASHGLVVVDAATARDAAAHHVLAVSDVVVWVVRQDRATLALRRLDGPLTRGARGARWLLALTGRGRSRASRLPGVAATVQVARAPRSADEEAAVLLRIRRWL